LAEHATFEPGIREAIALAAAAVDGCDGCQAAHTASGRKAGLSSEQTIATRAAVVDFGPKMAALLAVARQLAANVGEVADGVWKDAIAAGWNDTELTELLAHVAVKMFTNFNHYVGTDLDLPAAPGLDQTGGRLDG
jgi:AhpD family alkylhydroperoxidase